MIARTSVDMRWVLSCRSAASERAVSEAETQATAIGSAGPACCGHLVDPRLVEARRGERLGVAPRVRHAVALEQLAHRVLGVGGGERVDRGRRGRRAVQRVALQGDEPLGVLARDARLDEAAHDAAEHVQRVAQRPAVRSAAAAGLLSSCARPADIWPSAASFSRCISAPSIRAMTGRKTCITRSKAGGLSNSRRLNVRSGWRRRAPAPSARGGRSATGCPRGRASRRSRSARPACCRAPRGRPAARRCPGSLQQQLERARARSSTRSTYSPGA